jgi:hypothetical protein
MIGLALAGGFKKPWRKSLPASWAKSAVEIQNSSAKPLAKRGVEEWLPCTNLLSRSIMVFFLSAGMKCESSHSGVSN